MKNLRGAFRGLRKTGNPNGEEYDAHKSQLTEAVAQLNAILQLNGADSTISSTNKPDSPIDNSALFQAFFDLFQSHKDQPGYWVALDICEQAACIQLLARPQGYQPDRRRWATTATLFYKGENVVAGADGYVYWFSVELHDDFPGLLVPDILSFGLTDFSLLQDPIQKCWEASGLAKQYRGIWRLTSHYLGDDLAFKMTNRNIRPVHLPKLSGGSLQAAVLASLWAAAGKIPLAPEANENNGDQQFHELGGESLRLIPQIAISASLEIPFDDAEENTSIPLKAISDKSILSKVHALAQYSHTYNKPEDYLFDTAIIFAEPADIDKVRKDYPKDRESKQDYRGIRIVEECQTVGDALNWMLEVNVWKRAWNIESERHWLEQWGCARNEAGEFLTPDDQPITFAATNGKFKKHNKRKIVIDDDTQKITLQLENGDAQAGLASDLQNGLKEELEAIVKTLGVNTGSLQYLRNPIGGAVESDEPDAESPTPDNDEV
jgi:hypothetical protein